MKNIKFWRVLNAVVWTALAVVVMSTAYKTWSTYGEYGWVDFFGSLIFHGGFALLMGGIFDSIILKLFKK